MDKSILSQASQHEERNILAEVCNLAAARDDVIDLSVGDPNFATPLPIVEAATERAKKGTPTTRRRWGCRSCEKQLRNTIKN
ncbi:hypothetical protein AAEZ42_09970 [Limosilactobacillus fermentum]